eukprot:6756186-Prymnesium_polylepis.1
MPPPSPSPSLPPPLPPLPPKPPSLPPYAPGVALVSTGQELHSIIPTTPGSAVSVRLQPGAVCRLGGQQMRIDPGVNVSITSDGGGAVIDGELQSRIFYVLGVLLDGELQSRIFYVLGVLHLKGVHLRYGKVSGGRFAFGAGILIWAQHAVVSMVDSSIIECHVSATNGIAEAGAVMVNGGGLLSCLRVIVHRCTAVSEGNNDGDRGGIGGAFYVARASSSILVDSSITACDAVSRGANTAARGGAIYNEVLSVVRLTNVLIRRCTVHAHSQGLSSGGGLATHGGSV